MNSHKTRDVVLALTGLAALTVYILACTSFSPDDRKVLYPAFDPASGGVGLAVYDRDTKRSDMVLVSSAYDLDHTNTSNEPALVRGQWLADGKNIVVTYAASAKESDEALSVALVPWGVGGITRLLRVAALEKGATAFLNPLCISGKRLFLQVSSHEVARLDLVSGRVVRHDFGDADKEFTIYPAPSGDRLFCIEQEKDKKDSTLTLFNPDDFSRAPLMAIPEVTGETSAFAFDSRGTLAAFMTAYDGTNRLVVIRKDQPVITRTFDTKGTKWHFGNGCLSPKGEVLWATYQKQDSAKATNASYGLIEVPFSQAPVRETTLIETARPTDHGDPLLFEAAVSHDGKTAAVASTYLAADLKPADCALFLVDLSSPERKVTKVPIPTPPRQQQ